MCGLTGTIVGAKIDRKWQRVAPRYAAFLVDFGDINLLFVQFVHGKVFGG